MKKGFLSYCLAVTMTAGAMVAFSGCNSSDTPWNNDPANYSGTQITSFNLKADKAILNNLDSVFFSIDLIDARIFNANPLPLSLIHI